MKIDKFGNIIKNWGKSVISNATEKLSHKYRFSPHSLTYRQDIDHWASQYSSWNYTHHRSNHTYLHIVCSNFPSTQHNLKFRKLLLLAYSVGDSPYRSLSHTWDTLEQWACSFFQQSNNTHTHKKHIRSHWESYNHRHHNADHSK